MRKTFYKNIYYFSHFPFMVDNRRPHGATVMNESFEGYLLPVRSGRLALPN